MRELHKDWEILLCNTLEKSEKGETTSAHLRELLDNLAKIEEEIARLADQERQLRQEVQEKVNEREAAVSHCSLASQRAALKERGGGKRRIHDMYSYLRVSVWGGTVSCGDSCQRKAQSCQEGALLQGGRNHRAHA